MANRSIHAISERLAKRVTSLATSVEVCNHKQTWGDPVIRTTTKNIDDT